MILFVDADDLLGLESFLVTVKARTAFNRDVIIVLSWLHGASLVLALNFWMNFRVAALILVFQKTIFISSLVF